MKRTKLSLTALAAFMLASASFVGCTSKDYGAEIDNLQKQITDNKTAIASLQTALSKGLMITKLDPTNAGYKFTMSDGKVYEVTNGKDGLNAPAPKLRVNAVKNWEISVDGGLTYNEVKDAAGNPIADAKTFAKNYVKINEEGYLVIGETVTELKYDMATPEILIFEEELYVTISILNTETGVVETATVPMEGYFDRNSVAGIKAVNGNLVTFTANKTVLQANQVIGGVAYPANSTIYHSEGIPVVLNPSMINAEQIEFRFVASLEGGEAYTLPMTLKAVGGTDQKISTITKSTSDQSAIWTIHLASPSAFSLKGSATNVALQALNSNGTKTFSDYVFGVQVTEESEVADLTTVLDAHGYEKGEVTIVAGKNIIASSLCVSNPADTAKVEITRADNGRVVNHNDAADGFEDYTGNYVVRLKKGQPLPASKAAPVPTEIGLIYTCIGQDGAADDASIKAIFENDSPIASDYVVEEAIVVDQLNDDPYVVIITQDQWIDAVFKDNKIAKADFKERAINFKVVKKAAPNGVSVDYTLNGNLVESPADLSGFDQVKITVLPTALFAEDSAPVMADCLFGLTFQYQNIVPPTFTAGIDLRFALNGTSPVAASAWKDELVITVPVTTLEHIGYEIQLADLFLYADAQKSNRITTTGAVANFQGLEGNTLGVFHIKDNVTGKHYLFVNEAPSAQVEGEVTLIGTDAWGKEFKATIKVAVEAAPPAR